MDFPKKYIFFKKAKGSKFAAKCVSKGVFFQKNCRFSPYYEVLLAKTQKIYNVGKLERLMKK